MMMAIIKMEMMMVMLIMMVIMIVVIIMIMIVIIIISIRVVTLNKRVYVRRFLCHQPPARPKRNCQKAEMPLEITIWDFKNSFFRPPAAAKEPCFTARNPVFESQKPKFSAAYGSIRLLEILTLDPQKSIFCCRRQSDPKFLILTVSFSFSLSARNRDSHTTGPPRP